MDLESIFPQVDIDCLRRFIADARRIAITCHISPDGDALGSSLGLACVLRRLGKTVHIITPDMSPAMFSFLPGYNEIVAGSLRPDVARGLIANCDLLFCLDYNQLKRVDRLADSVASASARKVVIDHHLHLTLDCNLAFSAPEKSSTSLLVYLILEQMGLTDMVDIDCGTCLMTGMITDTGNFSYSSQDPQLFLVAAELVARGVNKDEITRLVLRTYSLGRLQLNLFALSQRMTLLPEYGGAIISLSEQDLSNFNYQKGDTEGLVNVPLGLPGIAVSVFVRSEKQRGMVKVSVRSLGDYPANKLCAEFFGGGGHANAAGGEFDGTLDDAVATVRLAMEKFAHYANQFNQS